ncbi:MAG: ABC transporter permease subunit [Treponema sp.]|jgi:putative aldouronate transport system permease protein|nr:ABC transporter permease subunit [Treponema sp.]
MGKNKKTELRRTWRGIKSQLSLQVFALLGMAFLLIFAYIPMSGLIIAFKDYRSVTGFAGFFTSPWTANFGFKHFIAFFKDPWFARVLRNTLGISVIKLLFSFPAPIVFALALNELRCNKFKRIVQTISYLPHFISWVVVYGLVFTFLNTQNGLVNRLLSDTNLVSGPVNFLANPDTYWAMAVITDVWKELGWWSIIFLAAITGLDPALYDAARIDGAGRLACIWHITLPGIRGTTVVLLVLALGGLFSGGMGGSNFEQTFLMGNSVNYQKSMVIGYYAYQAGILNQRYSFATAVGLFQSLISVTLVLISNRAAKKVTGEGIY